MSNGYCRLLASKQSSRYRPGVTQRVGKGIALLFHDRGTRRGWVVSSTPRPHFIPGKDPVTVLQKAGWAPGSVWTGGKSRPHRDSIPAPPVLSSVAIPTELPGPHVQGYSNKINLRHWWIWLVFTIERNRSIFSMILTNRSIRFQHF